MTGEEVFEVSRKLHKFLGWFLVLLGLLSIGLLFFEWSPRPLFAGLVLPLFGTHFLLSARNVEKIVVDNQSIKFMPVGAEFKFSEAEKMHVPSWVDRFDAPSDALGGLTIETNTEKARYVPGVILQWNNICRLNFNGSDGVRILKVLRQHIPE